MNYVDLHPEHALNGRRITAFSVDFEPRENAGRWAAHLCYWVEFSATQKKPFSIPVAVDDIAAAQVETFPNSNDGLDFTLIEPHTGAGVMGYIKNLMLDIDDAQFDAWLAENYPDVVAGSEEWGEAEHLYYQENETLDEQAQWDHEHGLFVASLNNVHQRYLHSKQELKKLHALLDEEEPELVYRMSFVHAVTVMESYLIYCARALLEHDWPLKRFRYEYYLKLKRIKNPEKHAAR